MAAPAVIELEVTPAAEELTLSNNRAALVINGVRDRYGCCWCPANRIRASGPGATS